MAMSTPAFLQSLKTAAKPSAGGQRSGDAGNAASPDQENAFKDLVKGMGKPREGIKTSAGGDGNAEASGSESAGQAKDSTISAAQGAKLKEGEETVLSLLNGSGGNSVQGTLEQALERLAGAVMPGNGAPVKTIHGQGVSANGQAAAGLPQAQQLLSQAEAAAAGRDGKTGLFAKFAVEPETAGDGTKAKSGVAGKLAVDIGTITVLKQETHFAPTLRLSPIQQIGDALTTVLKEQAAEMRQASSAFSIKSEGPVLKTLEIQLKPIELGTVKVSLKMIGDQVEVTLKASNPQTVELLKSDRQLLDQMLRATGYKPDMIAIQAADDRPLTQIHPASSSQNAQSGQMDAQTQGQHLANGGQPGGEGRAGNGGQDVFELEPGDDFQRSERDAGESDTHRGGDLYL
ncbi:flagellar hook-length control protein FliK [Roseibium sp. RKSG952]|uniref:flagellar hook-length control protein FliK n=1 Tax=Roseibium sp. RKSG952 TaxID=2529384 RepID=UPI0012BBC9CA|nr:flagellar hook-length control protein FliK [Roseibium sp. RKSG952]MTH98286.1 hypothetical protein [Roseibium sp. RKSG952]